MPNMISALFQMYDEYRGACKNLIDNIDTPNIDYLLKLVCVKGDILRHLLIHEKVVVLNDEEKEKQKKVKLSLLKVEEKAQEAFRNRYEEIKDELAKIRASKKILNRYNPNTFNLGARVDISQ